MKNKHLDTSLKIALLSIALFSIVSPVFATGVGEKIGGSLTSNINALIPAVLLAVGAYFLFTRDWMKMISFVAIAVVVAIFTNWTWVQAIGKKIYESFVA
jgi:phosphatidylglycerophosphate synthase